MCARMALPLTFTLVTVIPPGSVAVGSASRHMAGACPPRAHQQGWRAIATVTDDRVSRRRSRHRQVRREAGDTVGHHVLRLAHRCSSQARQASGTHTAGAPAPWRREGRAQSGGGTCYAAVFSVGTAKSRCRMLIFAGRGGSGTVAAQNPSASRDQEAAGCQNSATGLDLGFYAARSYSSTSPADPGALGELSTPAPSADDAITRTPGRLRPKCSCRRPGTADLMTERGGTGC
jgi:hypothetical protein